MRHRLAGLIIGMMLLAGPPAAWADPPSRPLSFTTEQFENLRQLQAEPQHAAVLDTHAGFKSQRDKELELLRASDDFWTVVHNAGFPITVALMLICAAPL